MGDSRTHFDIFALKPSYALDREDLERRYREASRHWHPDRFTRAPAAERAAVLQRATDLNQAYQVLKNDARRAEYLLKLHGVDLTSEEPGKKPTLSAEFLNEVLELREELLELSPASEGAPVKALRDRIDERMAKLRQQVASDFLRLEAGDASALVSLSIALSAQRYYQRFVDELDAQLEAVAEKQSAALHIS